jgi:hypothetical protein
LNGLSLGVAEAPMLTEPLPKLDSALDPDGTRCNDHAEWLAGLGYARLAFDQLDLYRDRGLEVANGSRFWRPFREINSARSESPRERRRTAHGCSADGC